ncbi:MAG TPA: BamA/TamA family outer membrane protein [Steroidobacteraceae bacterium]|nr:BamA/TamA family outer membrane protein [Steroidobacteraceae bacterium]
MIAAIRGRTRPLLRCVALCSLAAALAEPGLAAKLTDTEHTQIEEPRPPGVPSDAALEADGAVIGSIDIDIRNIFDKSDPRENNNLFMLANHLHLRTKRGAIKAQLLFKSGDRYNPRALAETERNLRKLIYVYDAHVFPVRYADGTVDIKVITKDVWTLTPGISFGRSGGTNSTAYDISDTNFLGWGKKIQLTHSSSVDRTSNTLAYSDPNVFGTRWTAAMTYADSSDGHQRALQIAQPFFSLDTRWSASISALSFDRTVSRYNLGNIVDQFNDNQTTYDLSGGVSKGLIDGWSRRLLFGMHYDQNLFVPTPVTSLPANPLPPDRTLSYPYVGFDILKDNFKKVGDQNEIGRTEDLYFGTEVTGQVGLSNGAFGAHTNAIMLAATALRGFELPYEQQLFLNGDFSSRVEDGRARNLIADGSAKYYWRWRTDWLLYAALSGTVTDSLDPDQQLLLGGDNGMRGYPLRYESGTSRGILTVEQRVFTDWYPFRLVRVGAAAFADVGRTWGSGVVGNSDPGLLRDVGLGLRLGNTRSGLGNVVHVDFAFPLGNTAGIKKFQFLVQTFQSF